jgi:josephin
MRCGVHALNNALQFAAFSVSDFEAIADQLAKSSGERSWLGFSSYRAPLGLGQYNVSVLEVAASRVGREIKWHDRRKALEGPLGADVEALLANRSSTFSRHWFAVRRVQGTWYNLDSKLAAPMPLTDEQAALALLNDHLAAGGELLFLVRKEAAPPPAAS